MKPVFSLLIPALFLMAACSEKEIELFEDEVIVYEAWTPAWPALALLKAGENPLWFELAQDGPVHIESPSAAALIPFVPWPHAWFITGMQLWDDFLVMAANREGFLILAAGAEPTELVLYRAANSNLWNDYTTESFFTWENKPAALLYRNDFFSALSAPPLAAQVFVLSTSSPVPVASRVPALEILSSPWETELLRRGLDGFWYYRMKEKGKPQNDTAYFRTEDLASEGIRISVVEWRGSDPRSLSPLAAAEDAAFSKLPALPEGFVYSGVVIFGNVIVASWEEQQDASIGAAGFMVMVLS